MTTQPQERQYEVRIFGYGASDIGFDGPNFYPFVAHRFRVVTEQAAVESASRLLTRARHCRDEEPESEWVGAAVYLADNMVWQSGITYTDEEIEYAWL